MSTAKPVQWGLLPDDVLTTLGAKDSLRDAAAAFAAEMRAWGIPTADGLVASHLSVLNQESEDGVVWVDKLAPLHAAVASGQEPRASTADRLTCALALLRASHQPECAVSQEMVTQAQHVVCDILLDHPVLLHPRLVFHARRRGHSACDVYPLLPLLIAVRRVTLPSATQGVDPERLRAFANSKLVVAPFKRQAPKKAWVAANGVRLKEEVQCAGNVLVAAQSSFGTPAPGMVASMLELSRLRGYDKDILAVDGVGNDTMLTMVRSALPRNLGLHRYHVKEGFHRGPRHDEFLSEVRRSRCLHSSRVRDGLAADLGDAVFIKIWEVQTQRRRTCTSQAMVEENANIVIDALVDWEVGATRREAATWLAEQWLHQEPDPRTPVFSTVPEVEIPGALGFFLAAEGAGVPLECLRPTKAVGRAQDIAAWRTAYEVFCRQRAMEQVFAAVVPDASTDAAPAELAPRRRMRDL